MIVAMMTNDSVACISISRKSVRRNFQIASDGPPGRFLHHIMKCGLLLTVATMLVACDTVGLNSPDAIANKIASAVEEARRHLDG